MSKRYYFDYASSTPVDSRVLKAMEPYWQEKFANPGAIHNEGVEASKAVENSRDKIASFINADPEEIIFTGSGTEANNLAILGAVRLMKGKTRSSEELRVLVSTIEHPSVRDVALHLKEEGIEIDFIRVNKDGLIDLKDLRQKMEGEFGVISVMMVNSEIGAIEPIDQIAKEIKETNEKGKGEWLFHVDASQALSYLSLDLGVLGVDLLSLDAQKIYGPKGVGLLYKKKGVEISPILFGGGQEKGLRPGTENVPGIVGFAKALEITEEIREEETKRMKELQEYFIKKLEEFPKIEINGNLTERVPNNINISIPGFESEFLVLSLNQKGFACSSKSACFRDEGGEGSHVIRSLEDSEGEKWKASSTVRFSMGRDTTKEAIDKLIDTLTEIIKNSKS